MKLSIKSRRESVLRSLYSSQNGLVVHCSAVEEMGDSFIFAGIADAGKSTLANKLSGIMTVINDDMNILEFSDTGIKVSTYFTQSENQGFHYLINESATGILKAVLFPVKETGKDSFLELLTDKGFIWKNLLTCVAPPIAGEDHLFPDFLLMIDRLIDAVPFYSVHHNLKDPPDRIAYLLRSITQ
ncbi:MAG TPA: hypothetical protein P5044_05005 [bacterium]|nr:hypothetical protein [bacterium]